MERTRGREAVRSRRGSAASRASSEPDDLASALDHARAVSRDGEALVEQFVAGDEVTVNAFLYDGFHPVAVTDRERASAFGVATAHLYPGALGRRRCGRGRRGCVRGARSPARAGATCSSSSHPTARGVMEVAARLGGGHDAELCAAATGVDLAELAVRAALGESISQAELVRAARARRDRALPDRAAGRAGRGRGRR